MVWTICDCVESKWLVPKSRSIKVAKLLRLGPLDCFVLPENVWVESNLIKFYKRENLDVVKDEFFGPKSWQIDDHRHNEKNQTMQIDSQVAACNCGCCCCCFTHEISRLIGTPVKRTINEKELKMKGIEFFSIRRIKFNQFERANIILFININWI